MVLQGGLIIRLGQNNSCQCNYLQKVIADLEVNDAGDQLWVDFCFITCGAPSRGPAQVMPGDIAQAAAGLWRGMMLTVSRNGKIIYNEPSS